MSRQSASTTKAAAGRSPAGSPRRSATGLGAWAPLAAFAAVLILGLTGLWSGWERAFHDLLLRTKTALAPAPLSPRIVPVDLNDRAERNLGSAVESRLAFAELLRLLGEGRLVGGMDFLFAGVRDPRADAAMVAAAASMDALVMAVAPVDPGVTRFSGKELGAEEEAVLKAHLWHPRVIDAGRIPRAETFLLPFTALAQASRHLGHIGLRPDADGIHRKVPLFYRWEDGYMPAMALALAAAQLKVDPSGIVVHAGLAITLPARGGTISIPIDEEGQAWIPYPASWDWSWKRTPLDKVIAAAADPDQASALIGLWDGAVVLAADITTGAKDFGATPLEPVYPLSGIHASLLNGILTRHLAADPPAWFTPLLVALLGFAVALLCRIRPPFNHLGFGLLAAALLALAILQWAAFSTVPWFVPPFAAVLLAWLAALVVRLFKSHVERSLLESALSRYIPRALAARVLDEGRVDLKPRSRTLTLLFADIAGFTRWSSDKGPDLVHEFLTDYLGTMADIVFEQGGTVDKFMGDGILAFFGDPFEQPDHARRAVRAALGIRAAIPVIRERWARRAGMDLHVRVGLNSGEVIVGNLGTEKRIEYTVIGAAVNLAERMESNAPEDGILATESTCAELGDGFELGDRIELRVKSYDEPISARIVLAERSP